MSPPADLKSTVMLPVPVCPARVVMVYSQPLRSTLENFDEGLVASVHSMAYSPSLTSPERSRVTAEPTVTTRMLASAV